MGIQSDLATVGALGCHGLSVTTALLVADSARVEDIFEIDADWLVEQARLIETIQSLRALSTRSRLRPAGDLRLRHTALSALSRLAERPGSVGSGRGREEDQRFEID